MDINKFVDNFCRDYPELNKMVSSARQYYKPQSSNIFLYLDCWSEIAFRCEYKNTDTFKGVATDFTSKNKMINNPKVFESALCLSAVAPWRYSKTVYRFDKDLIASLSEMKGDIPVELFHRLANYSICIELETPIELDLPREKYMFSCLFVTVTKTIAPSNDLLLMVGYDESKDHLISIPVSLQEKLSLSAFISSEIGDNFLDLNLKTMHQVEDIYTKNVRKVLPYVLYLVSEQPDINTYDLEKIEHAKHIPQTTNKAGELRLIPKQKLTYIAVGEQIGNTIREYNKANIGVKAGKVRKPHIRQGHWHLYWTGAGRTIPQLHWLSPIVVNEIN